MHSSKSVVAQAAIGERTSLRASDLRNSDSESRAKKLHAAREFEAYFVQSMMKEMRKTVSRSGLLGGSETLKTMESMLDEALARAISEGRGVGLVERLMDNPSGASDPDLPLPRMAPPEVADSSLDALLQISDRPVNISSSFGWRQHPIHDRRSLHAGVDIALPAGSPVHPVASGTVRYCGYDPGYGYSVIVDHENGFSTRYAHASELLCTEGQVVQSGDLIARSGSSGLSTNPHLHFELRRYGKPIDPGLVAKQSLE